MLLYQFLDVILTNAYPALMFFLTSKALNIKSRWGLVVVGLGFTIPCCWLVAYGVDTGMFRLPITFLSSTIPMLIFSKDSIRKTLLWSVTTVVCSLISEALIMGVWMLLFDASDYASMFTTRYLPMPMFFTGKILAFLTVTISIFPALSLWRKIVKKSNENDLTWFFMFPVSQIFTLLVMFYYVLGISKTNRSFAICILVALVCTVADIYLFSGLKKFNERRYVEQQNAILQNQIGAQFEYYLQMQRNMEMLNKMRHDFRNQLQTAYSIIDTGDFEKAKQQLNLLTDWSSGSETVHFCENHIIDALMQSKNHACLEADICLTAKINLPEKLSIDGVSLCSLFANILDNAIAACEKTPGNSERKIDISCQTSKSFMTLKCANTNTAKFAVKTELPNGNISQRGLGIPIIKEIVNRYHGTVKFEHPENEFTITLWLPLNEETQV